MVLTYWRPRDLDNEQRRSTTNVKGNVAYLHKTIIIVKPAETAVARERLC
jgi:hypothetical protein